MTRMDCRRSVFRSFDRSVATPLILGCALGLTWPTTSAAAKLDKYLTSQDLAGRVVLDQNGQQLTLPTAGDRHPTLPDGSTPSYIAIPLYGGEHLPGTVSTLDAPSTQSNTTVGPLNFDAAFKASLSTVFDSSRLAIVDTSSRNYLVEYLPGPVSGKQKADGTSTNPVTELAHLVNTGSNQFSKLTQSGMNELDRLLKIGNSGASSTKPSLNLEAQLVGPPLQVPPPPVPEPSTWVVFAVLIAGATRSKLRLRR